MSLADDLVKFIDTGHDTYDPTIILGPLVDKEDPETGEVKQEHQDLQDYPAQAENAKTAWHEAMVPYLDAKATPMTAGSFGAIIPNLCSAMFVLALLKDHFNPGMLDVPAPTFPEGFNEGVKAWADQIASLGAAVEAEGPGEDFDVENVGKVLEGTDKEGVAEEWCKELQKQLDEWITPPDKPVGPPKIAAFKVEGLFPGIPTVWGMAADESEIPDADGDGVPAHEDADDEDEDVQ